MCHDVSNSRDVTGEQLFPYTCSSAFDKCYLNLGPPFLLRKQASGRTKSLLIGINYVGQQGELAGCHNDVVMMKEFIGNNVSEAWQRLLYMPELGCLLHQNCRACLG